MNETVDVVENLKFLDRKDITTVRFHFYNKPNFSIKMEDLLSYNTRTVLSGQIIASIYSKYFEQHFLLSDVSHLTIFKKIENEHAWEKYDNFITSIIEMNKDTASKIIFYNDEGKKIMKIKLNNIISYDDNKHWSNITTILMKRKIIYVDGGHISHVVIK